MLSDGFIFKREDRSQKDIYIQLIDYSGLDNQRQPDESDLISIAEEDEVRNFSYDERTPYYKDNNIYKFVTQFEIIGTEKRIPDGIVYVNGLPLVVIGF